MSDNEIHKTKMEKLKASKDKIFNTKNKKFVFRMGYGYGILVDFSSLAHSIPIILPTFGFGLTLPNNFDV